ncbi:MAG: acylphosphatase [Deltaproteobacteria bacterium]
MNKRLHALFSGHVQGVGFRFTVRSLARTAGATGWVRNLPDGTVEVLAEAEEGLLADILARIDSEFEGYIRDKRLEWQAPTGEFNDFGIRL